MGKPLRTEESDMTKFASPPEQAINLVRYIGDQVSSSGKPISTLPEISQSIGARSVEFMFQLLDELCDTGLIQFNKATSYQSSQTPYTKVNLTLKGWEQYEEEKRGKFEGNYGFIAMQFDDPDLEAFVQEVVKPAVKDEIGYDLVDMRDIGRAGVIDNIMRVQIRDAKFVIVDLTHDNNGAYWEAGFAEGLGKPVIYICKKEKFEDQKTHFDTNHCTTVPWSRDEDEGFRQELTATLRRSLDLSS